MPEIKVLTKILEANETIARENRKIFNKKKISVINLMSGPGAGKTTLLEKTIKELKDKIKIGVIEGDISTSMDAERIKRFNTEVVQINTESIGGECHIDANMIKNVLPQLNLDKIELLIIENVGNLVCPAEFNVGEDKKVMILSVTEGDDKPLKYPLMFHVCQLLLINKIDLLPFCDFDLDNLKKNALRINPQLEIIKISAKTGEGLEQWNNWLINLWKKYK